MRSEVGEQQSTEQWKLGEFEITDVLGEGGSGIVYEALFRGGPVALKVLRDVRDLSDRERKRFLEEAERMRRVEHVGLIGLLGAGVLEDGRPYICMPRLKGETLRARLDRGRLPLADALAAFDTLARAVGALHRAGLIHRDIKPENVFLEEVGGSATRPVLLDFGIARHVDDTESTTTAAGQLRGTPAYMAPERFFGTPANERTDVYELAVTLYMMLVGRTPWDAAQDAAARLSPKYPSECGVQLPAALVTLLLRALSTRPDARPASAEAFADAVCTESAAPGPSARSTESLATTAPPARFLTPPSSRGRVRTAVGAGLAVVVIGLLAVGATRRISHARDSTPTALPASAVVVLATASAEPPVLALPSATPPEPDPRPVAPSARGPIAPRAPRSPLGSAAPSRPAYSATSADPERYYLDRK